MNYSNVSPNLRYFKVLPSKGIDIKSFQIPFINSFEPYSNLCNTITRSASFHFICYPQNNYIKHSTISNSSHSSSNNIPFELLNKNRCLVDDVMVLPSGYEVALLIPLFSNSVEHIMKSVQVISDKHNIQFGTDRTKKYLLFVGTVRSNNKRYEIENDLVSQVDIMNAFKVGRDNGYGITLTVCQVMFDNCNVQSTYNFYETDVLVKWIDVLNGRKSGVQIWAHLDSLCDFSKNFKYTPNNKDSLDKLNAICGYIFDEVYMDKIYMIHLLTKYYMVINQRNKVFIDSMKNSRQEFDLSLSLSSENFKVVNTEIDRYFDENAMKSCYTDFSEITQPLLSRQEIDLLVTMYKEHLPIHYNCLMAMFGFDRRSKMSKNQHLTRSGFYDRLVFFNYLTQARVSCNHSFTFWGMVTTASAYSRGKQASLTNSFFGNSTTLATFLRHTKQWREEMIDSIKDCLKTENDIVCCIDNNQKGHNIKYQRFGSSNKYVKVTGCIIKQYMYYTSSMNFPNDRVKITYLSQVIPLPIGMPDYENQHLSDSVLHNHFKSAFKSIDPNTTIASMDFTGN